MTSERPRYAVTDKQCDAVRWAFLHSDAETGCGPIAFLPEGAIAILRCSHGHHQRVLRFPKGIATGAPAVAHMVGLERRVAIRRGATAPKATGVPGAGQRRTGGFLGDRTFHRKFSQRCLTSKGCAPTPIGASSHGQ